MDEDATRGSQDPHLCVTCGRRPRTPWIKETSKNIPTASDETSGPFTAEALPPGPLPEKTLDGQLHPLKRWNEMKSCDEKATVHPAMSSEPGRRPERCRGSERCSRLRVTWGGQWPRAESSTPTRVGGWGGEAACVHVCVHACARANGCLFSTHCDLFLPRFRAKLHSPPSSVVRCLGSGAACRGREGRWEERRGPWVISFPCLIL